MEQPACQILMNGKVFSTGKNAEVVSVAWIADQGDENGEELDGEAPAE